MADNLRLRVVLDLVDRVLSPLKRISAGGTETARALKAAKDQLKQLNAQQAAVKNVQDQSAEFQRLNNQLKQRQALLDGMRARGDATRTAMAREENAVAKLTAALDRQRVAAGEARRKLNEMGITGNLSAAQARLKTDIDGATAAMAKQRAELAKLAQHQRQLAELREKHAKAMMHTGMAVGAGVAMQAAGRRGVDVAMGPAKTFSQHEDHMLGIARQVPGARDELGKLTPVYKAIEQQVRELSHEVPVATTAIADMMTAAARMEVPTDQLKEFTRMASEMSTAFDAAPDHITESMGKVAKNFKIPLTEIRGLADAINYLDDNAISKGADIIDFLNRTSGVVSTVAMSASDAAALGSTLLTLGERSETASTAANAIVQKFAAATKGTKKFRDAMAELGLSTEEVQKGMSTDATATLNKVIAAIGKLPADQRIGVMVELVGLEHSDTLAKLVDKPEELARQRQLANSDSAKGSMAREAAARNATLSAQWQMFANRLFNLRAVLGEQLAPVLAKVMGLVVPAVEAFTGFVKENPTLVRWVLGLALGLSAVVAVLGAVLVPIALVAGKFMLIRFLLARLGLAMASTAGAPGLLARAFSLLQWAALGVGRGIMFLGRALLATPLGRAFSLLAISATMVYRNWDGIKGGLVAIWEGVVGRVKEALSGGVREWAALLADFSPLGILYSVVAFALDALGIELPNRFSTLGSNMIQGLVNGITAGAVWVKAAVVGVAQSAASWFAETLGIASPSRLFMQYGSWVSEGAALGIQGGQGGVRNAALAMAAAASAAIPATAATVTTAGATIPTVASTAAMRIDNRGPLRAQPLAGAPVGAGAMNISITINAAPGQDERAIARAVAAEFERQTRQKQSRVLSQIHDID